MEYKTLDRFSYSEAKKKYAKLHPASMKTSNATDASPSPLPSLLRPSTVSSSIVGPSVQPLTSAPLVIGGTSNSVAPKVTTLGAMTPPPLGTFVPTSEPEGQQLPLAPFTRKAFFGTSTPPPKVSPTDTVDTSQWLKEPRTAGRRASGASSVPASLQSLPSGSDLRISEIKRKRTKTRMNQR